MDHREAFLKAIRDDPDNDTPRLVYADWLEEHGDGPRAEFIRVQCELASGDRGDEGWQELQSFYTSSRTVRPSTDDRVRGLRERERDLWFDHRKEWRRELPAWAGCDEYHRGFAREVWSYAGSFLRGAGKLWDRTPVVSVRLYGLEDEFRRLAGSAHLTRLRSLEVYNSRLGPEVGQVLARSRRLAGLRALRFSGGELGPEVAAALANNPHLATLQSLDLHANPVGREGIRALVGSPHLRGLRSLGLSSTRLRVGAIRLLAAASLPALRRLNLACNALRDMAVADLVDSPLMEQLTDLDLYSGMLGRAETELLAESPNVRNLKSLNLSFNQLGNEGARALAESPMLSGLRTLFLRGNSIDDDGARALAKSTHLNGLTLLAVNNNPIGPRGRSALTKRFGNAVHLQSES